jgi:hypothetical protein
MYRPRSQNPFPLLRLFPVAILLLITVGFHRVKAGPIYDFDGDGRTDFIVKRQNGPDTQLQWFVLQSRDGFTVRNWGYQFS